METYSISARREWGPWATVGFGVVIGVVSLGVQVVAVIITLLVVFASNPELTQENFLLDMFSVLGLCTSIATIASAVIGSGILIIIIAVRKGISIKEYLGIKKISRKTIILSLAAIVGIVIISNILSYSFMGRQINSDFMIDIYMTSVYPVLLWIAIVVAGPVYEEAFFRGFLYTGFINTRLGLVGTVVLTSIIWTSLHIQYGIFELVILFISGIVLGLTRYRTGSLWAPIIMHCLLNAVAMIEVTININSLVG